MRTKFYTKKGDKGASVMGKTKIAKDDALFWLLGGLDELNSWLGFCRASFDGGRALTSKNKKLKNVAGHLLKIQDSLFIIQAEVASIGSGFDPKIKITEDKVRELEDIIAKVDKAVPPLTKFIIPGASEQSARLDIARTMARKTERAAKTYSKNRRLTPSLMKFLNRLSSVLFALARYTNWKLKIKEKHPEYR